jgi:hypothetical protein
MAGNVARIGERRNAYRILVEKLEGKRPLGRPRHRWVDNPCGGGVEYLHREPASRKRRRNWTKKRPRHSLSG